MSAFWVGQRVRILWSSGWPELRGEQGLVVPKRNFGRVVPGGGTCEYSVAPDRWGTDKAPHRGAHGAECFAPNGDQLEPILPPGLESKEDALRLWEPEDVTA